jgi:hypothetical protein
MKPSISPASKLSSTLAAYPRRRDGGKIMALE